MIRQCDSPCLPDCPRRRAVPSCHDAEYCPAWGEYSARKERERQARVAGNQACGDYTVVRRPSRAWQKEIRRRRGK